MDFIGLVWLIPAIMAIAALINGLGCRKLGEKAGYISVAAMVFTFLLSALIFFQVRGIANEADHAAVAAEASRVDNPTGNPGLVKWNTMNAAQQAVLRAQYTFAPIMDPENPMPWETSARDGAGGHVHLWTWIDVPSVFASEHDLRVDMAFHVDQLTAIFLLFISFVGSLVFIYATGYMREDHHGKVEIDPGYARFFSYLALFAASMYILILGANFVVMFIGWEGVGLCSYLLIGFFYNKQFNEKLSCADAGKKAFIVNRVGDFGLMLGMFLIFWGLGSLSFQTIIHSLTMGEVPNGFGYSGVFITAATLLLFLGATGKSAQIPLFIWLPDAMAGPTPVSALIHAATMVTAGVYMLARLNVLYMLSPTTLAVVAVIGALTAFVAAVAGCAQRGIKKILAYSTVSQLGFMFLAIGVGSFAIGIFHVFTHAFFKACLFLAAGSVIHALHHEEDVFKMGGLWSKMPKTAIAYLAATIAIAGFFPFAGFFSKDEILYMVHSAAQGDANSLFYTTLYALGAFTALLTAFYMFRSFFLTFTGKTRMSEEKYSHVHESPISMSGVLIVLAICSLIVGWVNIPSGLIPLGNLNSLFWGFLEPITDRGAMFIAQDIYGYTDGKVPYGAVVVGEVMKDGTIYGNYHGPELLLAILSMGIAAIGLGIAWMLYKDGNLEKAAKLVKSPLRPFWNISLSAWKWDEFYDALFVAGSWRASKAVLWVDKYIVDGIVNGSGRVCRAAGIRLRQMQNGQVQVYGLVMFIGACLFLLYFAFGISSFTENTDSYSDPASPLRDTLTGQVENAEQSDQ
ncbi:MAG: NADH-quinone oxidoreductase subunit L [Candidatus Sumerlaeia bacterium]|nr:NADH-quinone oxidoreductase subunit L [Candidatus Sumerlaeia bacterium]